jgi:hypothetical protein
MRTIRRRCVHVGITTVTTTMPGNVIKFTNAIAKDSMNKPPKILDRIADKVLSYKAPARTKKQKKRQRKRRAQRESSI